MTAGRKAVAKVVAVVEEILDSVVVAVELVYLIGIDE